MPKIGPSPVPAVVGPGKTRRGDTIAAVRHAVAVLKCISDAGAPIGVNEIARRVGLHRSSISRLVGTLERECLVSRDPSNERITLGFGLVALAAPVLAMLDVKEIARPVLEALARDSGETVSFSVWDGSQAVSVEQALGASAVRTYAAPGRRNPGHSTAAGKSLLAHAGEHVISAYCVRPLARSTPLTITDPAELRAELDRVRRQGYAVNLGELESDVGAASAPVRDRRGHVVGTITATVPMYRFGSDKAPRLIDLVVRAAAAVTAKLALVPPSG